MGDTPPISHSDGPNRHAGGETPPSLPYQFVNEHGVVTQSVACRGCGYDLLSFSLAQVCPECGWPVSRSVQGSDLSHSPPAYLRTLHTSILIILIALLVDIVPTFGVVILDIVDGYAKMQWQLGPLRLGAEVISFVANVVTVWGFWRLTTPDPTLTKRQQRTSAYWVLRIATIVAAVTGFGDTLMTVLTTTGASAATGPIATAMSVFSFVVYVLTAAWISATMHFIASMARRVPDRALERHSRTMVWLTWVLMFPGMIACFAGPIASIIYFFIASARLRSHIGRVLREQAATHGA